MEKSAIKTKIPRSIDALTIRLCVFALALWMIFSLAITLAVAEYTHSAFRIHHQQFSSHIAGALQYEQIIVPAIHRQDEAELKEILDQQILRAVSSANRQSWWRGTRLNSHGRSRPSVLRDDFDSPTFFHTAVIFYDRDGNILRQSSDLILLWYYSEEAWFGSSDISRQNIYLVLGENAASEHIRQWWGGDWRPARPAHLQITGYFEGGEFKPIKFSYITETDFFVAQNTHGRLLRDRRALNINQLVSDGWLEWDVLFDYTAEHDGDLVTIFISSYAAFLSDNSPGGPIRHQGAVYDDLLDFLNQVVLQDYWRNERLSYWGGHISPHLPRTNNLREILSVSARSFADWADYDFEAGLPIPETDILLLTAVSSRPLLHAISELRYVYIATLIILAIGVLIIRKIIHRNLTEPLEEVNKAFIIFSEGRNRYSHLNCDEPTWAEPTELIQHYQETTGKLWANANEITRLNTALDYAQEAEQNRRQMTSNIAHELKTPLAIIHSYSEGLKERIAEEKREQYLDVILSESERMDSMVLEMLDLSRLEAGKVKLARDDFSLPKLTLSIFDKHEMAMSEKELKLSYEWGGKSFTKADEAHAGDDKYIITADEARIGQVISNFATNAIKYTPHGGNVHIKIYSNNQDKAVFSIENDSNPLSRRELSEIWESFYQADNARTGTGAGLGLAIAKSIIDLHGGTCFVRNTKTGVEFSFVI